MFITSINSYAYFIFIFFKTQDNFGILAACFREPKESKSFCLVHMLEPIDSFGILILNEFDCPLLTLIPQFKCISSDCIIQSISVIHQCLSSCKFTNIPERHQIDQDMLCYVHDYDANIYALNVYCMQSPL